MADETKIEIGVEAVGADEAAKKLEDVGAGAQKLATGVGEATEKLAAGDDSAAAFDAELKKLEETFERVTTAAGKLKDLPLDEQVAEITKIKTELETARTGFEKLGADGKVAVEKITTQIESLDETLGELQAEATKTKTILGNMPDGVKTAFLEASKAADAFFEKATAGRVTERDMKRLWLTQENLRHEIEKSGKAISDFGVEGQEAMAKLDARTKDAAEEFRRLDDAVDAGKRGISDTKDSWVGLDQAMAKVLGKNGDMVIQGAIAVAAIKQMWTMWKGVEEAIGANNSGLGTMTGMIEDAGVHFKTLGIDVQASFADLLADVGNLTMALANSGTSTLTAREAFISLGESAYQLQLKIIAGKDAVDFYNAAIAGGANHAEAYTGALWQLKEAEDAYEIALRKGPEAMALWVKAMESSKDGRDALKQSMVELIPVLEKLKSAEELAAEAAAKHAANTKILDDAIKLYNTSAKERIGVDQTYYEELAKLKGAQEENSFALEQYAQIVAEMLPDAERQSVAIEKTASKMDALLKNTDGLTDAERKHIQSLIDRIKKIDELSTAEKLKLEQDLAKVGHEKEIAEAHAVTTRTVTDAAGKTKTVIENLAAEQGKLNTSVEGGRQKFDNFGDGLKLADGQIESTAGALARLQKAQGEQKNFDDAEKGINQITEAYRRQETAVKSLADRVQEAVDKSKELAALNVDEEGE